MRRAWFVVSRTEHNMNTQCEAHMNFFPHNSMYFTTFHTKRLTDWLTNCIQHSSRGCLSYEKSTRNVSLTSIFACLRCGVFIDKQKKYGHSLNNAVCLLFIYLCLECIRVWTKSTSRSPESKGLKRQRLKNFAPRWSRHFQSYSLHGVSFWRSSCHAVGIAEFPNEKETVYPKKFLTFRTEHVQMGELLLTGKIHTTL